MAYIGMALGPAIIAFAIMFGRWRRFGNDPKGRGVIIPEYEPPDGFNVLQSQFMLSESLGSKSFSAAIIELAVKRYLTISEIKQKKALRRDSLDYILELVQSPTDQDESLQTVVEVLFGSDIPGSTVKISDFKKSSTSIISDLQALERSVADKLTSLGLFQKNPKKVRSGYLAWSIVGIAVSFSFLFIWPLTFVALGVMLASFVVLIFGLIMPARTEAGVEKRDQLLGLRDYIKLAEADRLSYLQSPQGAEKITEPSKFIPKTNAQKVKLFEKLLPYAMLFGMEKEWAKQFKDIYKSPPDWYRGNWATFNTVYLASSLNSFSTASGPSFSTSTSSSSSGFSSGGGFSGGGGGGGGGGGW